MPGDPNECRKHAANCRRLAKEAKTPDAKEHFTGLAEQWDRLAAELESTEAFLKAMAAVEPRVPSEPSASVRRKA